jgi:hypothetical protein
MATILYMRTGSKPDNVASSREVSVDDLVKLYGAEPSSYKYLKGGDSPPQINKDQGKAKSFSDPSHVVVKIESDEVNKNTFPEEGFYIVRDVNP